MRAHCAIVIVIYALGVAGPPAAQDAPLEIAFHHIHVNHHGGTELIDYYAPLFDSTTTRPTVIGGVHGIEADGVFLLVNSVPEPPPESGGAGWHFGWGSISLDEAYDQHRMQEIDLKLPLPSFAQNLHLHLESEDPIRAAEWYRDRFAATIATRPQNASVRPSNPLHRRPAAIVTLRGITLAIYQATETLGSSRNHRIDHAAFVADLAEARAGPFSVLEQEGRLGPFPTMMIEGPDRFAIELLGPAASPSR